MTSPFELLRAATAFYRRQPVLNQITLWLFILPTFGITLISRLAGFPGETPFWGEQPMVGAPAAIVAVLAILGLNIVILWGVASLLVVGKRLVQSKAGRSRTSFKAVRTQAAHFIIPLLLTGLLRGCITILWTLLLIVPGIVYAVRTTFYNIIVVIEKKDYRQGLDRSKAIVLGRTWPVFLTLLCLTLVLVVPIGLVSGIVEMIVEEIDPRLLSISDAIAAVLGSIGGVVYILALVEYYGQLVGKTEGEEE